MIVGGSQFFATVVALVTGREQWARQSIMELGVEDRETQPVDGQRYWFLLDNAGVTKAIWERHGSARPLTDW